MHRPSSRGSELPPTSDSDIRSGSALDTGAPECPSRAGELDALTKSTEPAINVRLSGHEACSVTDEANRRKQGSDPR